MLLSWVIEVKFLKIIEMLSMLKSHELFLASNYYGTQQNNNSMYVSV